MIADPEGPSFIVRTVEHRRYSDGAFVTHDPKRTSPVRGSLRCSKPMRRALRTGSVTSQLLTCLHPCWSHVDRERQTSQRWMKYDQLYFNFQLFTVVRSPHVPHYRARHQIAPPHHLLSRLWPGQRPADHLRARLAGVVAELAPSVAVLFCAGLPRHRARYARLWPLERA